MTEPINLTGFKHHATWAKDNNARMEVDPEVALALIDTAEAALADQAALDKELIARGLPAFTFSPETHRLRETLNRYTTTP